MSKVTLKVEIDEEAYKQIKGDSVCSNNNECIISKSSSAYYALNAIINATPITECDDVVSRQAVNTLVDELARAISDERSFVSRGRDTATIMQDILDLPSVLPKREQGEWIEEFNDIEREVRFTCSSCGEYQLFETDFCPNCGAEMR